MKRARSVSSLALRNISAANRSAYHAVCAIKAVRSELETRETARLLAGRRSSRTEGRRALAAKRAGIAVVGETSASSTGGIAEASRAAGASALRAGLASSAVHDVAVGADGRSAAGGGRRADDAGVAVRILDARIAHSSAKIDQEGSVSEVVEKNVPAASIDRQRAKVCERTAQFTDDGDCAAWRGCK